MQVSGINFKGNSEPKRQRDDAQEAINSVVAWVGGGMATSVTSMGTIGVLGAMKKIGTIPQDRVDILHEAAEKAIKVAGVDKFGVKIKYLEEPKSKRSILTMLHNPIEQIKNGYNACFFPKDARNAFGNIVYKKNTILMPEKGLSFAAFHEIGHSINANKSLFWRTMQKTRKLGMIGASFILLYGAFSKNVKSDNGKELTTGQKANNFVRNNAGKLSFAVMLPMLAEEAMASIRGQKLANKLLDKNLAKYVKKGNTVAFTSYLISAAALALGSYAAVKIKDKLTPKEDKKTQIIEPKQDFSVFQQFKSQRV